MIFNWHRLPHLMYFRAPEGGEGGGGGAGKTGEAPAEGDKDKPLTVEQLNGALTQYKQRVSKDVAKAVDEKIAALKIEIADAKAGEGTKAGEGKDAVLAELNKKLDSERKAREAMETKLAERDRKAREQKRDLELETHLEHAGLTEPTLRDGAAAMLLKRGFVKVDEESDRIMFVDFDEFGNERELDLAQGIKKWSKSDAAKRFIPAKGTGGSGERRSGRGVNAHAGTNGGPSGAPPTEAKALAEWQAGQARRSLRAAIAGHLGFLGPEDEE